MATDGMMGTPKGLTDRERVMGLEMAVQALIERVSALELHETDMEKAVRAVADAADGQDARSYDRLHGALDALNERQAADCDRLASRCRETQRALEELAKRQDGTDAELEDLKWNLFKTGNPRAREFEAFKAEVSAKLEEMGKRRLPWWRRWMKGEQR